MSAPRKKLSGAEYRRNAKYKELQGKQCAYNMNYWLRKGANRHIFPDQTNQDFSQSDSTVQTSPSLSMCDEQSEQLKKKPEYRRSESPYLDSGEMQKTGFDLTDPDGPGVEKMTDEQRSFF
ncbi:hypothetical protein WA026_012727 [Henosepilachna vigintioctopunctata]|uniref:Uncharacterized protein n=1 Tax=Henosepilachna vigintioctopunctata TaxID=420089 RepID=A0AAW1U1K4_9CUCU